MMKPSEVSIFLEFIEKKLKFNLVLVVVLVPESTFLFNETSLIQTPKGGEMQSCLVRGIRLIEVDNRRFLQWNLSLGLTPLFNEHFFCYVGT